MVATIGTGELLKGRYRLERMLGRGGMAAVWLGQDEVLERPVAVKVLSDTIAGDPGFVARFRREAQVAARLSHPNLVGVYDFSEEGERPYLVMQFVPGENLAAHLERGADVDCEQLARELLEAVAHIHAAGILHRDIKPGNIVIEPGGTARLIDFGIAQPRDATAMTKTGLILGTERFAAPEVMEGNAATEQSDLYSCGVVLRSCEGPHSRALDDVIEWLTADDPNQRPSSARQALARLERAEPMLEEPTQAFTPEPVREPPAPPPPAPVRSSSHRGRWGAVAALLAIVAALAVVALVALGGDEERQPQRRSQQQAQAGGEASKQKAAQEREAPAEASARPEEAAETPEKSAEGEAAAATTPAPEEADPASGSALNEQGYELIQAGEYDAAVPVLEEAVASFPEGSEDLAYAYALFNLGNALRLSGRPEEAIPVLERRLEIPNQTGTVEEELEAARDEAG
ncbi:MAG: serine/threonine protein kinase [Actinobacteria bacterium]|nr:MAG: serine/threonine protein kinase [Actinomycetota bacterium]